jgi:hypothetical protein
VFGLPLHQKDHTFCENSIVGKLLLCQFEVGGTVQVVMSFVEILLQDLDFCNFVQRTSCELIVLLSCSYNLLKVKH